MKLHGRTKRTVRMHLIDYKKLMKKPLKGFITYGGGLNILMAMKDAQAEGFNVNLTPSGVELR